MRSYTKILTPLLLAIIVGSLTFVFAQKKDDDQKEFHGGRQGFRPPPPGGMRGGMPPHILERLNLTDDQKTQVKALHEAAEASSKSYFDAVKSADDKIKTMMDGGTFSEEQARQILTKKSQALTELELIHLKTDQAVKNILTAEQKTQLETLKKQAPPEGIRGEKHGMPPPQDN